MARREAQLARQEAEEARRELARRKDEFLGTVSHELRTPLTVVCGYAELLLARDAGLDGEARRMMGSLLTSATQLSLMVDDMLDFARIERGNLDARPREVDLVPVVQLALVTLRPAGRGAGAGRPAGHFPAYADPERCGQIVNRLVANALQHAPGTEVTVPVYAGRGAPVGPPGGAGRRAGRPPGGAGQGLGALLPGPGATIAEGPRGAGIGLALVKATAEAQAGEVGAWSSAGRGSRFWVDLPVAPPGERTGRRRWLRDAQRESRSSRASQGEYDAGTAMEPDTQGLLAVRGRAPWPWPRPERRQGRWRRRRCSGAGGARALGRPGLRRVVRHRIPAAGHHPAGEYRPGVLHDRRQTLQVGLALLGLLTMSYTAVPAQVEGRRSP